MNRIFKKLLRTGGVDNNHRGNPLLFHLIPCKKVGAEFILNEVKELVCGLT
jgi:hypothetical protein